MTVWEVLIETERLGVQLTARDGRLRYEALPGALTPALRAEMANHKPMLLGVLWRLEAMREIGVDESGAGLRPPVAKARREARGGPGRCFSCGDALPLPTDYGRCDPCEIAADLFYAPRPDGEAFEVVA